MIKSVSLGYVRSFREPQTLNLSMPDGGKGSGYNLLVGKNNSGKSTVLKMVRDLISRHEQLVVSEEARHDDVQPIIDVDWWSSAAQSDRISIQPKRSGGHFPKSGPFKDAEHRLRYVPSRRPFTAQFESTSQLRPPDYEWNDYVNRRNQVSYFDAQLSTSLAPILADEVAKVEFVKLLQTLDMRITDLDLDNIGSKDVIRFRSASGRWHPVVDTGDGLINSVRTIFTLMTADEGSCLLIDEPELSLHPELQRNLYRLMVEFSRTHQILIATHSPYFVDWSLLSKTGTLTKVTLNTYGNSELRAVGRATMADVAKASHNNITSRKNFDVVAKELFFSDEALLVEGSDDVNYLGNFIEGKGWEPLPLIGYGCGGAELIRPWMRLCKELGIRCAALFDGDKSREFGKAIEEFTDDFSLASFLLFRPDIRDKYKRDASGKETNELAQKGVFRRDGQIHAEAEEPISHLITSIRTFLFPDDGRS